MVKRRGFTLVECMVALVVFSGILLAFAISSQGLQRVKQQQENDTQVILVNQFIKRLENDAHHYHVTGVSEDALAIFNTRTNKHYLLGLKGYCLCLYRSDGKFISYLLRVKYLNFKEIAPHLYQITLKFTNEAVFKEEIYINE